jgi:hypothetical protein
MNAVPNGSEPKTPVQLAQERLVAAIGQQAMDLPSAAFSGYANAVVSAARLTGLVELLVGAGLLAAEDVDRITESKLTYAAEAMEARARQPKLAIPGR